MTDTASTAGVVPYRPGITIPFGEAVRVWLRVALLSFGGPAGQIAVMHRILVDEKRWVGENRFLQALNYCMLLPGPEAQQLAVYLGWLLHRTAGGVVAGTLFILPGFIAILLLSYVYAAFGSVGLVEGLFFGLKAAVLALVVQAVIRIGRRALKNPAMVATAVASFLALFLFDAPFPLVVIAAGLVGFVGGRSGARAFAPTGTHGAGGGALSDADSVLGAATPAHARPDLGWSLAISGLLLAMWLGPVAVLLLALGPDNVFSQIAVFFGQMAVVTFGGAYAVLAYVAQQAVENYGWLNPGEMLDGLGMAETTPGPLIMVVEFVGFMGAYREPGGLHPMLAGTLAATLTTWVTFVPSFLWIFLGAPFIERLRENRGLNGALSAITAAVVGVIASLALWFALHVFFAEVDTWRGYGLTLDVPVWATLDLAAIALAGAALVALVGMKLPMFIVLGAAAMAGVGWTLAVG
jgi:chromate transporter